MKHFFDSEERKTEFRKILESWMGTPFKPLQRVKQSGADCVQFAGAVDIEIGLIEKFNPEPYTMDGGIHNAGSALIDWLDTSPSFEPVGLSEPRKFGDHLCFSMPRNPHHVGILTDQPRFIHCPRYLHVIHKGKTVRGGVRIDDLRCTTWKDKLAAIYRPLKNEK